MDSPILAKYLHEIQFAVDEDYVINYASENLSAITGKPASSSIGMLCYEEIIGRQEPCLNCPVTEGGVNPLEHDIVLNTGERKFFRALFDRDPGEGLLVESLTNITAVRKDLDKFKHDLKRIKAQQVTEQLQNREIINNYSFLMDIINRQTYGLLVASRTYDIIVINSVLIEHTKIEPGKEKTMRCYEVYGNLEPCMDCPFTHPNVMRSPRKIGSGNMTVTYSHFGDYLVESVRDTTRELQLINEIRASQEENDEKQRQMELLNKDLLRMNSDLKVAQRMIDEELRQVGELQHSLLPESLPNIDGYEFGAFYIPAEHAGGDYYDCIRMSNNYWGFTIADVSGHGTPAAVIMAMARVIMRSYTYDVMSSSEALYMVNEILCDNVFTKDFVTMFYTVLDSATGKLNYASAGHNPMLLFDKSDMIVRQLKASGMFLAAFPGVDYEEKCVSLDEGDILFMYTDGLVEAMNPRREQYGMDRVISHIIMYNDLSCKEMVEEIMADVKRFTEDTPFDDDVTIFVVKKTK